MQSTHLESPFVSGQSVARCARASAVKDTRTGGSSSSIITIHHHHQPRAHYNMSAAWSPNMKLHHSSCYGPSFFFFFFFFPFHLPTSMIFRFRPFAIKICGLYYLDTAHPVASLSLFRRRFLFLSPTRVGGSSPGRFPFDICCGSIRPRWPVQYTSSPHYQLANVLLLCFLMIGCIMHHHPRGRRARRSSSG